MSCHTAHPFSTHGHVKSPKLSLDDVTDKPPNVKKLIVYFSLTSDPTVLVMWLFSSNDSQAPTRPSSYLQHVAW